ncbi:MAG: SRPBCC family protein [Ornithinimicrobium sp.]
MGKAYSVERSITINSPVEEIYPHVVDLKQWDHWSPWADMDPEMDQQFTGPEQGVGQSMSWSGNRKVGEGSMTITDVEPNERVALDLAFLKPFRATNTVDIHLVPAGDSTHVQWVMRGELNFMMQAMAKVKSMDDMVGPDFERGLANLKRVVE